MARRTKRGGARPGSGRKPKGSTAMSVVRTIKLTPADAVAQDAAADAEGQVWPDWIRGAADDRIARTTK
ncbi:MAG TPA: hypothetical protein VFT22_07465 [Kofleriaceae bacterium]|nr:hypothetical protein [Kofleriaceae bacterium]